MNGMVRSRLLLLGAVWGLVLAIVPAVMAFDDPFTISPFLVAALSCAAASGAVGTLIAGCRAANSRSSGRTGWYLVLLAGFGTGAAGAVVAGTLAALSIWGAMAVNMSGLSTETPDILMVLNIFRDPAI